ncbi:TolC family protein [Pedobacter glucosidilyticus]|uniref:TolC family protein n=1 Tax=Pedobacter glucosidilyticus TaxID=1122941 RepID=UPI0003FEE489|nr:TolC family protein [Pedobacter glucosidilyticus]
MKYIKMKFLLKNFSAFAFFLILSLIVKAQDSLRIDLNEAIRLTLQNNLQVKQAQFQTDITSENLKQSRYEILPNIRGAASANRRFGLFFDQITGRLVNDADGLNGNLNSSVTLFQGGQLRNQILQNKVTLLADKTNIEKVRNDLTLSVVTSYLQVLTNRDLITASEQQVALSNAQLNVEQKNFDVGNKTLADLSQVKAQLATNELNLTNAKNAYDLSILELKQLMELNPQQEITVQTPNLSLQYTHVYREGNEVYKKAVENYPDIKLAQYNSEAFKTAIKVAKGGFYPSLSFGGGLGTSYSNISPFSFKSQLENNVSKFIGVDLSIPIFNNYRSRSSVNIAKIRYQDALVTEQLAKNNLNKIINQAVLDLRSAEKRYVSTQSSLTSSKDAFEVIKKRYDVGLANAIELNTSQTNYNKAQFDFIQAKYDLLFRAKVIDFYLGNPINL